MKDLFNLALPDSKVTDVARVRYRETERFALRVEVLSRPTEESYIRFVVWLPEDWNGILLGLGSGGVAGKLIPAPWWHMLDGYAAVHTDMGTSRFLSGEQRGATVELYRDYTWRSTHLMTVCAKLICRENYGRPPSYSYFIGASAGGLQALSEVQRFPEDYDGVIAGVPSNNALNLIIYFLWLYQKLHREDGSARITEEEAARISQYAAAFFRARGDGEPGDDFVSYPYTDENTVEDFLAYLRDAWPSLTEEAIGILRELYRGPRNPQTGEQIFCGMPIGAERNSGYFKEMTAFGYPWLRFLYGDDYDDRRFDFREDYERLYAYIGKDFTANDPNLAAFCDRGGKLIVYLGVADPAGPYADALHYYNRVCDTLGGVSRVLSFFRFFLLPGKAHGDTGLGVRQIYGEGQGVPLLTAIRKWREEGKAPAYLSCAHITEENGESKVKFTRDIYPYLGEKRIEGKEYPPTTCRRYLGEQ